MTSKLSAVHRGIAFEERARRTLQAHCSMALRRVGGRSDGGIDLLGWWWLPFASVHRPGALQDTDGLPRRRLRVLAQCKAEKKKFTPKYVREMEGVWHLHSSSLQVDDATVPEAYPTVALLLSESPFSRSTALHAFRSTVPFLLVRLPLSESDTTPAVMDSGTVCPNPALVRLVKPLAFRWERNPSAGAPTAGRPGLWWQGRKLSSWAPDSSDTDTT